MVRWGIRAMLGIAAMMSLSCGGGASVAMDAGLRADGSNGGDAMGDARSMDAMTPDAPPADVGAADATLTPRIRKSLVLALDGLRPDAFAFAETPHYDSLIEGTWQPGYRGAYSPLAQNLYDAVTLSGPNHVAIMTGATGEQHGVTGNGDIASGDFDTYRHYLRLIEEDESTRNTASLFTWTPDYLITSGADLEINASDAENIDNAVRILRGEYTPGEGALSRDWALGTDPDAMFLFLDDVDHAGHADGFEIAVSEYVAEIEELDAQLGSLLEAIAGRPRFAEESWQIVMTSDHGGYETNHGADTAVEHTIPFLVAGLDVEQGRLPESTTILDVVPTVLRHMQVEIPEILQGMPRGDRVETEGPSDIGEGLVRYYRFEDNLVDSAGAADARVGAASDTPPTLYASGGRFGGYLDIDDLGGGAAAASYLTVGGGEDLRFGTGASFTVTLWFRSHGRQSGDPVIIGNKDWVSGTNPGWLLLANEGGENSFGSNYASTREDRIDLEDIDYADTDWWFLAAVFRAGGLAVFYAGNERGEMRWMAYDARGVRSNESVLPINIGQDGTGSYAHNLDADLDDLAIWRRALSHDEVLRIYGAGEGAELHTLRGASPPSP